jgi:UDP-glucose 4-epimerase
LAQYLITGAVGFIGSHLAHALVARGHAFRTLDNLSTGLESNLAELAGRIDFRPIHLRAAAATAQACAGVDVILHQAALSSVPHSVLDPRISHKTNINDTFNLLEGAGPRACAGWSTQRRPRPTAASPASPMDTTAPQPISP